MASSEIKSWASKSVSDFETRQSYVGLGVHQKAPPVLLATINDTPSDIGFVVSKKSKIKAKKYALRKLRGSLHRLTRQVRSLASSSKSDSSRSSGRTIGRIRIYLDGSGGDIFWVQSVLDFGIRQLYAELERILISIQVEYNEHYNKYLSDKRKSQAGKRGRIESLLRLISQFLSKTPWIRVALTAISIGGSLSSVLSSIKGWLDDAADALAATISDCGNRVATALAGALRRISDWVGEAASWVEATFGTAAGIAEAAKEAYEDAIGFLVDVLLEDTFISEVLSFLSGPLEWILQKLNEFIDEIKGKVAEAGVYSVGVLLCCLEKLIYGDGMREVVEYLRGKSKALAPELVEESVDTLPFGILWDR